MTYWDNWESTMMGMQNNPWFGAGMGILALWSLIWKGLALWKSARNDQRYWFVTLLMINTLGILEIIYLTVFAKTKLRLVADVPVKKNKSKK